jgi:hypothetical protein
MGYGNDSRQNGPFVPNLRAIVPRGIEKPGPDNNTRGLEAVQHRKYAGRQPQRSEEVSGGGGTPPFRLRGVGGAQSRHSFDRQFKVGEAGTNKQSI